MHTSACFEIVNKCKFSKFARFKFKDLSRIFKYFQAPYLFSSTFKGLEVFIPNSSIFKDFSSTLLTLIEPASHTMQALSQQQIRSSGRMMGQTDARLFHSLFSAYYASSANKVAWDLEMHHGLIY